MSNRNPKSHSKWFLLVSLLILIFTSSTLTAQTDTQIFTSEDGVTYTVEKYIVANYPVALAFTPDGRLFYTEKNTGNVRVIATDGTRQIEPVITLPTTSIAERGMLGIAIDPNYEENGMIWVAHSREATARDYPALQIVRFHEEDGVGYDPEVMLSIPLENSALIHLGGNLHFDAEGYLYFSAGNQEVPAHAQDVETPQGAIHRFAVTDEGLIPAEGNPFEDNSIFAYGFRNPFDFTLDPYSDRVRIFATENGDECDDEVNMVLPGFNYGAGENYVCGGVADGTDMAYYMPPMLSFTPTIAPTGIIVYDHDAIPQWQGDVIFCGWNTGTMQRIRLNDARTRVDSVTEIDLGDAMCRIDLAIGPEGSLYFSMVGEDGGALYKLSVVND